MANQRDDLLAFASGLDRDLEVLAAEFQVAVETARAVLNVELLGPDDPSRSPARRRVAESTRQPILFALAWPWPK